MSTIIYPYWVSLMDTQSPYAVSENFDKYYWLERKCCPECHIRMVHIDGNFITGKTYQCPKCFYSVKF